MRTTPGRRRPTGSSAPRPVRWAAPRPAQVEASTPQAHPSSLSARFGHQTETSRGPHDPVRCRDQAVPGRDDGGRRPVAHRPHGQDHRARRALGLRQDDQPADGQPDDRADPRLDHPRRPGHRPDGRGRAAARHGLRHPARRPLPPPHRPRQHRDRAPAPRLGQDADRASARASCSSASASPPSSATATPRSSPAGSSSASGSPGRWPPTRRSCSWTSPSRPSTPSCATSSRTSSSASRPSSARRSSSSPTTSTRPSSSATRSRCCASAAGSPRSPSPPTSSPHPADDFVADFVGRDRGYRALQFQEAPRLPLRSEPAVVLGEVPDSRAAWLLVVDDERHPLGWVEPARIGARAVTRDDLHRGGTLAREHGSLRGALDAALSSPSRRGVIVDDSGALCGTVLAHEVLTAIEEIDRPERDEDDPVHGGAASVAGDEARA